MKKTIFEQLTPGMITGEDVYALNGQLLVAKGIALTDNILHLLKMHSIRMIRIDDGEDAVSELSAEDASYLGAHIPEFVSNLPDETRKVRIHEIKEFKKNYEQGLNFFHITVNNLVEKHTSLDVSTVLNQTLSFLDTDKKHTSILEMLVYMKGFDNDVYTHSLNVSLLCNVLAHWMDFSEEDCQMAAACGMFHDIGMMTISEAMLQKTDPLTHPEQEIIRAHAEKGYHILSNYGVNETVRLSALMHHERCDGSGYPRQLKDEQIDRFAKLVTICDIYNAMTSERPYRKAFSPFAVLEHFETEGLRKFDARSILIFMENAARTYLNCPVRLSNGQVGYVVYINPARLGRPTVQCGTEFIDLSKEKHLSITEMLPVV